MLSNWCNRITSVFFSGRDNVLSKWDNAMSAITAPRVGKRRLTHKLFSQIMQEFLTMSTLSTPGAPVIEGISLPADPFGRTRDAKGRFINSRNIERTPTLKQIWKFTQNYMQALTAANDPYGSRTAPKIDNPLLSVGQYAQLLKEVKRYNFAIEHGIHSAAQTIGYSLQIQGNSIVTAMQVVAEKASRRVYSRPKQTSNKVGKVNAADVTNDLLAITRAFPTAWDRDGKTLKIITEPVTIVSKKNKTIRYNFGRFFIILYNTSISKPLIKAHTPRIAHRYQCIHPHVQANGSMCFGDGGHAMTAALKAGRLFDVVEITMSVLSDFGRSPHAPLEAWDGICDERFDPKTGITVPLDAVLDVTGTIVCGMCNGETTQLFDCSHGCGRSGCIGCMDHCSAPGCNNYMCENDYWVCSGCDNRFCKNSRLALGGSPHFNHDQSDYCDNCWEIRHQEDEAEDDDSDHVADEEDIEDHVADGF